MWQECRKGLQLDLPSLFIFRLVWRFTVQFSGCKLLQTETTTMLVTRRSRHVWWVSMQWVFSQCDQEKEECKRNIDAVCTLSKNPWCLYYFIYNFSILLYEIWGHTFLKYHRGRPYATPRNSFFLLQWISLLNSISISHLPICVYVMPVV